jgi:hypothetical protein
MNRGSHISLSFPSLPDYSGYFASNRRSAERGMSGQGQGECIEKDRIDGSLTCNETRVYLPFPSSITESQPQSWSIERLVTFSSPQLGSSMDGPDLFSIYSSTHAHTLILVPFSLLPSSSLLFPLQNRRNSKPTTTSTNVGVSASKTAPP